MSASHGQSAASAVSKGTHLSLVWELASRRLQWPPASCLMLAALTTAVTKVTKVLLWREAHAHQLWLLPQQAGRVGAAV